MSTRLPRSGQRSGTTESNSSRFRGVGSSSTKRNADSIIRSRVSTIREASIDPTVRQSSAILFDTSISKVTWYYITPGAIVNSMLIANTHTSIDAIVTLKIRYGTTDKSIILNEVVIPVGTSLLLEREELLMDETGNYGVYLNAASGTPTINITTRL
tara:strand:+ start:1351 stop:1821 length:471 start_codon:yes stop_codon:yes gene_type:complete